MSFPIEELADWIYLADGTINGRRDGGFTLQVLERRYGHALSGAILAELQSNKPAVRLPPDRRQCHDPNAAPPL